MAENTLPVTESAGAQAPTTQTSLQSNGSGDVSNGLTGKVQPGITADQLRSDQGIALTPTALPTINLGASTATIPAPVPAKHHFNPALMIISILLFVVAIALFRMTSQSGKKHN